MSTLRNFLKDSDLDPLEQSSVLQMARLFKRRKRELGHLLQGLSIGLLFEKPSLRTRVSAETACSLLGASPVMLRAEELHFHRGETPQDGASVLSGYLSLILARVRSHTLLEELAEPGALPIVNGLSDRFHPLQALADLLTISEAFNWRLKGRTLCYLGDGNNVAHSLILAGVMAGVKIRVAAPEGYQPEDSILVEAEKIGALSGGGVELFLDPNKAIRNAEVLYTDVWTSMGSEGEEEERSDVFRPYQLNMDLVKKASDDVIVLHCLPAHFGEEITREAFDSHHSRIIAQAHNRQPTAAAIFLFCLWREKFYELINSFA